MNNANRRGFLKIAGVGAAAAGAASLASGSMPVAQGAPRTPAVAAARQSATLPAGASGSMVAYVHDISNGEVAVMVEGREVTVTDHDLVARLATAVHATGPTSA